MHQRLAARRSFVAGSLAAAASFSVLSAPARSAQFSFKACSNFPVDHPVVVRSIQMWKQVENESGGRIAMQYLPGGVLGTDISTLSQLRVGALQFMNIATAALQATVPQVDVTNVGFAYKDSTDALRVMDGPLGEWINKEGATRGIRIFPKIWDSGMRQITSGAKPIYTPDDLHGFKIRINTSKIMVDLFKTLGASPAPVNFSEVYTALQTKLVDGNDGALSSIEAQRVYEVQRYLSMTNHTWSGIYLIANGDVWKTIPADLQGVIERNAAKFAIAERRDVLQQNGSLADKLRRQGMVFNRVDQAPFRARLPPYYKELATQFGPTEWGLFQDAVGKLS